MSSISGISPSWTNANTNTQQAQRQAKMFQKADADGSGGINATELQTVLSKVAEKTGVSVDKDAQTLLTESDANGDGNLSSDELGKAMQILLPPQNTMDFAQSRPARGGGGQGDDLFGKVDTDGSGQLNETELQSMLDTMTQNRPGSTQSSDGTGDTPSASELLAQWDADGNGELSETELEASRPSDTGGGQSGGTESVGGGRPPPPPGGGGGRVGGASESSSTSSASTTYDELDTNEDGVVSLAERMASTTDTSSVQTLLDKAVASTDGTLDKVSVLIQQLAEQYTQMASGDHSESTGTNVNTVA